VKPESICFGAPTRQTHSSVSIIHKDDYDATIALLLAVIAQLDAKTVARL